MRKNDLPLAWKLYEEGRSYNNRLVPNQYSLVETNTEFFAGNQWLHLPDTPAMRGLPKPTFNILKRVASLFIASLTSSGVTLRYEPLAYYDGSGTADSHSEDVTYANAAVKNLLEQFRFDYRIREALFDGARSGDYCAHFYFDPAASPYGGTLGQEQGEICMELHWQSDYQMEYTFDAFWERREERPFMGRGVAVMGTDDRYPALFAHAAEHGFMRLRWLLDLYELQKKPGFSWEHVLGLMEQQGAGAVLLETMLVMYRLRLPGLKDLECCGFSLKQTDEGLVLTAAPEQAQTAERAAALCDRVWPMLLQERQTGDPEWKAYDRLLPTAVYTRTPLRTFLGIVGPTTYEFELIDLPDWLFWLYFIIRPFNWVRRKLFGGKK